jgi:hypothetical protein
MLPPSSCMASQTRRHRLEEQKRLLKTSYDETTMMIQHRCGDNIKCVLTKFRRCEVFMIEPEIQIGLPGR